MHAALMSNPLRRIFAIAIAIAALPFAAHAVSPGERYMLDGRCVTVTRVASGQAFYEWSAGNASGSGNLPASELSRRCDGQTGNEPGPASTPPTAPGASGRAPAQARPGAGLPANNRLALDAAEAQSMVEAHNAVRAQVGVGPLVWDATLADFAQRYLSTLAGACDLRHSAGSGYGENLAAWTGNAPAARAVTEWADEKSSYRGAGGPFRNADMEAGHYTQVVWRSTTRVGCGRTSCSKDGFNWTLVSCNYSPRGNMMGARVY